MPKSLYAQVVASFILAEALLSPARGHVSLDASQAPAQSYVRFAARVSHGCDGAATVALRIQIPDGVAGVRPMPKPGWALSTMTGAARPGAVDHHGTKGGHGPEKPVREVAWRAKGGEALPDSFYDEFVLYLRTPDAAGQTLWFPFVQECEGGKVSRWVEQPSQGQALEQLRSPASPVLILPRP